MVKTYPENEVHLTAFNISGKPYLEESEKLFDEILIVDYSSTELHWTYEISRTTTVARLKTYGYILVRDESGDRKSPYVEYVAPQMHGMILCQIYIFANGIVQYYI